MFFFGLFKERSKRRVEKRVVKRIVESLGFS
jgi:hypothetical protein